jgi:hypothetical protein
MCIQNATHKTTKYVVNSSLGLQYQRIKIIITGRFRIVGETNFVCPVTLPSPGKYQK